MDVERKEEKAKANQQLRLEGFAMKQERALWVREREERKLGEKGKGFTLLKRIVSGPAHQYYYKPIFLGPFYTTRAHTVK